MEGVSWNQQNHERRIKIVQLRVGRAEEGCTSKKEAGRMLLWRTKRICWSDLRIVFLTKRP